MSAINSFVRKFKKAVGGAEEPADAARPFDWQPAPVVPAPLATGKPLELAVPGASEAAAAPNIPTWKKPTTEASSVIGSTIPADVADFAIVYKGAGVSAPAHGYGIDRVAQMLAHKSLAGLDRSVKSSAVLAALDAAGVRVQEVLHDGLLRYKALVAFEAAKELEALATRPRNERRSEELKEAMASFQQKKSAEIDALTKETAGAVASLQRLKSRQRAEEDRFHRTVSLFVEALPARVITMPKPEPAEVRAPNPLEAKPDLKLVAPPETKPAIAAPVGDQTIAPAPVPPKPEEKPS